MRIPWGQGAVGSDVAFGFRRTTTVTGMLPIRIIETEREDFDGPVVELWRDDDFIGFVFWDGESTILQVYPDGDGDVHDIDVGSHAERGEYVLMVGGRPNDSGDPAEARVRELLRVLLQELPPARAAAPSS